MYSREESQERTFKPKNEHEGKVIPGLKKGMYASLVNPMTQSLLTSLTKELHEPLQEALHGSLLLSLRDFLNLTLTHKMVIPGSSFNHSIVFCGTRMLI